MDMKKGLFVLACLAALAACDKAVPVENGNEQHQDGVQYDLRILPVMTKVTDLNFESGDAIGVTVTRESGVYAANQKYSYNGSEFVGELKWYPEGSETSTVTAYHPYAATVPASFTVQADQSAGLSSSDLLAGSVSGVTPSSMPLPIPFKHKLTKINVNVNLDLSGKSIQAVKVSGAKLTADLAADFTATVNEAASPAAVKAFMKEAGKYAVIIPPQKGAFTVAVSLSDGKEVSRVTAEVELLAGKQYSFSLDDDLVVTGDIDNWDDGGELGGANPDDPQDPNPGTDPEPSDWAEYLSDGFFYYHMVKYEVVKMKDGKWWMAQNLAYVPEGFTPSSSLEAVTAGVFYPLKINDAKTAAEFDTSAEGVAAKGYLYQAEAALGLKVGDLATVEAAQALEGVQGVCPAGWHIPTLADLQGLVGKVAGETTVASPYNPNAGDCYIKDLNADGFQMEAYGAVTIADNTKTAGTFMGFMSNASTEHLCSGMFCGSSYAAVTYNEKDVPSSGVKNLQFYGLMPMTNKATEAEYTCNGTKVSYRIAGPVRCVRNAAE